MAWTIVGGPRDFENLGRLDIDAGWAYDLEREGDRRTVSVIVAAGRSGSVDLPEECGEAIRTSGRSAIDRVLDLDTPPRYLIITTAGITERHA